MAAKYRGTKFHSIRKRSPNPEACYFQRRLSQNESEKLLLLSPEARAPRNAGFRLRRIPSVRLSSRGNQRFRLRHPCWRCDYEKHGAENDGCCSERAQRNGFLRKQPAQNECYHGIHQRVGAHSSRRALLQNVEISCKSQYRSEYNQIRER